MSASITGLAHLATPYRHFPGGGRSRPTSPPVSSPRCCCAPASRSIARSRIRIEIEHKIGVVQGQNRDGRLVDMSIARVTLPKWLAKEFV
jgi:hypothetical protein